MSNIKIRDEKKKGELKLDWRGGLEEKKGQEPRPKGRGLQQQRRKVRNVFI